MSPAVNLAVAVAMAVLLIVLLHPRRGLARRWWRGRIARGRILVEDALKHLYQCEYERLSATVAGLAGALEIGRDRAARLAARLESMGLVQRDERGVCLTPEGRSDALRVIRIHRLWERHLADHSGLAEREWHAQADRQEHVMTAAEADALSARLGHPVYDPHGDPIPTAEGAMPQQRGVSLPTLPPGAIARIVHVEDEPEAVYAQLVAARLSPGVVVRVLDRTPERIRIDADLQEHVLAPVVAANLSVEPVADARELPSADSRLSSLDVGQEAVVVDISPACHGAERRRLLDLGLVPGTRVRAELRGLGGDPTAYRIRGAVIALRRDQADWIYVNTGTEADGMVSTAG